MATRAEAKTVTPTRHLNWCMELCVCVWSFCALTSNEWPVKYTKNTLKTCRDALRWNNIFLCLYNAPFPLLFCCRLWRWWCRCRWRRLPSGVFLFDYIILVFFWPIQQLCVPSNKSINAKQTFNMIVRETMDLVAFVTNFRRFVQCNFYGVVICNRNNV